MISRYENKEIKRIWSEKAKFKRWLNIELAIIHTRAAIGMIPEDVVQKLKLVRFKINEQSVKEIEKIEKETKHDMVAFVRFIQSQMSNELAGLFHAGGITSYDIEEPAQALALLASADIVNQKIKLLLSELNIQIKKTWHIVMIGRTHGQHAEPITLGKKMLDYRYSIKRSWKYLILLRNNLKYSKISGAVGCYGHGLSVELEKKTLETLGLKRNLVSTQITPRDRMARYFLEIAILASVIEKMALDFRLLSQTEIREIQEPFSKGQTGSSVMPFKKNPITWEKICGLSRILKNNVIVFLDNNANCWNERDISQSSVERIIIPDSFHIICHILDCMTKTIKDLTINENKIQENLESSFGIMTSPVVKDLLIENGMDPKAAYELCQELSFRAIQEQICFLDLIERDSRIPQNILDLDKVLDNIYNEVYGYPKELEELENTLLKFKKQ